MEPVDISMAIINMKLFDTRRGMSSNIHYDLLLVPMWKQITPIRQKNL
jgi:hypothetical protein